MSEGIQSLVSGSVHGKTMILRILSDQIRDPETAAMLRREVLKFARRHDVDDYVIDFSKVRFMGSVGFLALMSFRREYDKPNVVFCGLREQVRQVFEVCGLISSDPEHRAMFAAVETEQEALEWIAAQQAN